MSSKFMVVLGLSVAWGIGFMLPHSADALEVGDTDLTLTLDSTFSSHYLWNGYDIVDAASWQPSLEVGYSNYFMGIWGQFSMERGFESSDELDYYVGYGNTVLEEESYVLSYSLTYTYFDYPNSDSKPGDDEVADGQEIRFDISLDNLLHLAKRPLLVSYGVAYEWEGKDVPSSFYGPGWIHSLGVSYALDFTPILSAQEEQAISISLSTFYNDGVFGSDHDWSHTLLTLSTDFEWGAMYISPSIGYQWSYEDTVNEEDEFYGQLALGIEF